MTNDVEIREVAGGCVGWPSRGADATLTEFEERMAAVGERWADVDAAASREAEAQAADARARERRHRELLHGRRPAGREVGKAISDAIFGQATPSGLCLDSPHHAEGPVPVREANGQDQPNAFVDAMDCLFEGRRSPITTGRARAIQWQQEQAGQVRSGQADGRGLGDAWERRHGGSRR